MKNALERNQNLDQAKQSFLNAGYSQEEINTASQKLSGVQVSQPSVPQQQEAVAEKPSTPKPLPPQQAPTQPSTAPKPQQSKPLPSSSPAQSPAASKTLIISLVVVSALILVGAAILGLYWDTFFG